MAGLKRAKQQRPVQQHRAPKRPKKGGAKSAPPPLVDLPDSDVELGDEDLDLVAQYGGQLSFLSDLDANRLQSVAKPKASSSQQQQQRQQAEGKEGQGGGAAKPTKAAAGAVEEEEELPGEQDGDAEVYERAPRGRLHHRDLRAEPLPVKSLGGDLLPGERGLQPGSGGATAVQAPQVPGVQVHDDYLEEKERAEAEAAAQALRDQEALREEERRKRREAAAARGDVLAELAALHSESERRAAAKQRIAGACRQLLEDPHKHVGHLRVLNQLCADKDGQVSRLCLLSCMAVYRDILPGYRIRLPTEAELQAKVSKDVQALRDHEAALLKSYQAYLKHLVQALSSPSASSNGGSGGQPPRVAHARVAARCMSALLTALPHFNYSGDLLQVLVANMVHRDVDTASCCRGAVRSLIDANNRAGGSHGQLVLEAVQLVADLVKKQHCRGCSPDVVRCLLGLRFDDDLPPTGAAGSSASKRGKKSKGKKGRKKQKEDEVDAAFKEAAAQVDANERRRLQSLTLEALFEAMFRVLKHAASAGSFRPESGLPLRGSQVASRFPLLAPSLEGLASYCHLIDVDYFDDLMAVLQQLLQGRGLPLRERLCCLLTVADILRGQGEALNVDRRELYCRLYDALLDVPMAHLEEEAGQLRLEEDDDDAYYRRRRDVATTLKGEEEAQGQGAGRGAAGALHALSPVTDFGSGVQRRGAVPNGPAAAAAAKQQGQQQQEEEPTSVLLCRLLERMVVEPRGMDAPRAAAFVKRVAGAALHSGPGEAMGCVSLINRLLRRTPKLRSMLEEPGGGPMGGLGGSWRADAADPSEAGGLAAPLWELALLQVHCHPHVAQTAKSVAGMPPAGAASSSAMGGVLAPWHAAEEVAAAYDSTLGRLRPAPPPSCKPGRGGGHMARPGAVSPLTEEFAQLAAGSSSHPGGGTCTAATAPVGASNSKSTSSAGLALEVDEERVDDELELAVRQYYRQARAHQRHMLLRREEALLARQVAAMRDRLASKQLQKPQKQVPGSKQLHAQKQMPGNGVGLHSGPGRKRTSRKAAG